MSTASTYYIGINGERRGPFTLEQLREQQITRATPVWQPGFAAWKTAGELAELSAVFATMPPPLPPSVGATSAAVVAGGPWNPSTIGWLTLLCTPIWGGIMAAVNARRLGLATPWFRPVGVAVVWIVIDGIFEAWWDEGYFRSLFIYLGCVWALWSTDLEGQATEFRKTQSPARPEGRWLVPGLSGAPLALVPLLAFLVAPFVPLEPRQVCERLLEAKTQSEFQKYATLNLQPALVAISKMEDEQGDFDYEHLGEEDAPANVGGYLVAYRVAGQTKGSSDTMEWLFHLIAIDGEWRVEDIYFTAFNGQAVDEPISVAANYQQLQQTPRLDQLVRGSSSGGPKADWSHVVKKTPVFAWFMGWKVLAAIVVAAGAWISSLMKQQGKTGASNG
jgi:hypothetical protein